MLSLAKRRQFLERADFVHRLNQIGENSRAAHIATNLRNEEERIKNQTRPVEWLAGHATPAHSASGRADARENDAQFARAVADRLVYPGMTPSMTPNYVPQTPRRRVPLRPPAMPAPRTPAPRTPAPKAKAKAKAKGHPRSEAARLRDIERKRAIRASDDRRRDERRRRTRASKK